MDPEQVVCPVCTLYLRPGITLKAHLTSHPKHKVIEALVRISHTDAGHKVDIREEENVVQPQASTSGSSNWNQSPMSLNTMSPNFPPIPGNHSFIYQQFMSSSGPQSNVLNVNPLAQQIITVPTVFNPQMMCTPYMYQQQQVIVASGPPPLVPRPLSIEMPHSPSNQATIQNVSPSIVDLSNDVITLEEKQDNCMKYESSKIEEVEESIEDFKEPEVENNFGEIYMDHDLVTDSVVELQHQGDNLEEVHDLSKACQTSANCLTEKYGPNKDEDYIPNDSYVTLENNYHTSISNGNNDLNLIEMDGMKLVLANDFMSNQVISQVDDYECIDRPRILMNIGGMDMESNKEIGEESLSRESTNIRADERMPARGELSGQESNGGASDITWCRVQYNEGSVASYDLLARETWDGSEDSEGETIQSKIEVEPETNFIPDSKCAEEEVDANYTPCNTDKPMNVLIGCDIGKEKVKKLVIKPKQAEIKDDNNFDNVFTNRLKMEGNESEVIDDEKILTTGIAVSVSALCTVCNEIFSSSKVLKQHKLEVHKLGAVNKHRCTTCGTVFSCEPDFTAHLKIHPLECRLCGKLFYRKQGMQLHLKRHLGIKPYKCNVCPKSFLTKQKHDEHKNIHTGDCPIKCNLCDETFRRYSNLIQHRNRHHLNMKKKLKDFVCPCGEVLHSKKKLAWHKETHDIKPKACTQCSEKFIHVSSLTRHMRRAHNENYVPKQDRSAENVECPICKGVFLKSSLEMHIRNHSGQRPYTCIICNKDFTTKWNLKLHKWTHASRTAKPFKCEQCKGAFIRESDYVAHMNSHKSVRPYTCNHCGAKFIRKYNCQRHVKEHEKVKTYSCQVCGKQFHRSYYLKDHMRIHSGVRPYSCNICGKTSTTKSNHNKHVRIHHAREPVSTEN